MIEYSWEILSMYTIPQSGSLSNAVFKVNWRFQGVDGPYIGDVYGVTNLNPPDPENYTSYDSLTKEQVVDWVKSIIDYEELKAQVDNKVRLAKQPPIEEKATPWAEGERYTGEEEYLVTFGEDLTDPANYWGPLKWSSERVNAGLAQKGMLERVPEDILMYRKNLLPKNSPLLVNETVKIYLTETTPTPDFDPLFQTRSDRTWIVDSGLAVGTWFVQDKDINQVKEVLRQRARDLAATRQINGFDAEFKGQAVSISTNPLYRTCLLEKYLSVGDEGATWRVGDQWFDVTREELKSLISMIDGFINTFHAWEMDKCQEIDTATSIEELRNISFEE